MLVRYLNLAKTVGYVSLYNVTHNFSLLIAALCVIIEFNSGSLMKLYFKDVSNKERHQTFEVFKKYMKPVVEKAIGWDEDFQANGFRNCLPPECFFWIEVADKRVGLVCFKTLDSAIYIHLLIIFENHQGHGYGSLVTEHFKSRAFNNNTSLRFSCFKNNEPALRLYRKLKFKIVSEDKHFFNFSACNENT